METVYLAHLKQFVDTNQPVYKIGKSCQEHITRFRAYPKGCLLKMHIAVNNSDVVERQIISIFKQSFIFRHDLGHEYFEGDIVEMKQKMLNIGILCDKLLPNTIVTEEITQSISNETDRIIAEENVCEVDSTISETILQMSSKNKTCPKCHKTFAAKSNLTTHLARVTSCIPSEHSQPNTTPKNFECNRCQAMFRSTQKLTAHMNRKKPCKIKSTPSQPPTIKINMVYHEPNHVFANTLRLKKNIYIKSQFSQV